MQAIKPAKIRQSFQASQNEGLRTDCKNEYRWCEREALRRECVWCSVRMRRWLGLVTGVKDIAARCIWTGLQVVLAVFRIGIGIGMFVSKEREMIDSRSDDDSPGESQVRSAVCMMVPM
jgi:hypothetical protein